ncbi:DUF3459 domain-containing protein, partial [Streptomyces bacillaris]|uniref:DUF3459 domain-containing protein n=1 Tax=Streptomyces bacillaris TaxID=68179 RepID=UPI0036DE6399
LVGTPAFYYGDERGLDAVKEERAGGDAAILPAYPSNPDDFAAGGGAVFTLHQELIGLRRRHPWLHRAQSATVALGNTHYVYELADGNERLHVALNLGDHPLVVGGRIGGTGNLVLAGEAERHGDAVTIPPHGWAVLAG